MKESNKKFVGFIAIGSIAIAMILFAILIRIAHTAHSKSNDDVIETTITTIIEDETYAVITDATTETTTSTDVECTTIEVDTTTVVDTTETTILTEEEVTESSCEEVQPEEETVMNVIPETHPVSQSMVEDNPMVMPLAKEVNALTIDDVETETFETVDISTTTTLSAITTTETITTTVEETTVEEITESSEEEVYLGNFRITGYVATGNKTASGEWPCAGRTIAMNKTQFKNLGLKYCDQIRIDGLGTFTLEDCGCKSGRIDVFVNSVKEAYALPSYLDAYLVK